MLLDKGGAHTRVKRRKTSRVLPAKRTARNDVFNEIVWPHSWDEYVRGNVVSDSSAALITSFLLKTMVGSGENPTQKTVKLMKQKTTRIFHHCSYLDRSCRNF